MPAAQVRPTSAAYAVLTKVFPGILAPDESFAPLERPVTAILHKLLQVHSRDMPQIHEPEALGLLIQHPEHA